MNPTTTPETLTTAELARYLGQQCKHERRNWIDPKTAIWEEWQAPLDVELLSQKSDDVRNVRPVLKRLANITQEDAKVVYELAYGSPPAEGFFEFSIWEDYITVSGWKYSLTVYANGKILSSFEAPTAEDAMAAAFNATAVGDYLDAKGYDRRNHINRGLALEQP